MNVASGNERSDERAGIIEMLWGAQSQSKRGRKPTLSLEAIARTGIAIADADGLAAVTMQRVGEALDVTKMALYRHAPGKPALVALMIDSGLGEPPPLDAVPGDWRAKLDHWARLLFDRFSRHPWAVAATAGARIIGPNELGWLEQACAALAGVGLEGGEVLDVVVVIVGHTSTVAQQVAGESGAAPEQALFATMTAVLRGHEERFPALTAALDSARAYDSPGQALDFGLNRIFDGVALLIASRK